jgi:hypothetical protein
MNSDEKHGLGDRWGRFMNDPLPKRLAPLAWIQLVVFAGALLEQLSRMRSSDTTSALSWVYVVLLVGTILFTARSLWISRAGRATP